MKKINPKLFRSAMSKFATGVTIITINNNNNFIGKTVNSFASLSLNPPLILFSLDKKSTSLNKYTNCKNIGINILSKKQKSLSNHFSKQSPDWDNTGYFLTKNKVPMIKNSIANLNCLKKKTISQGDHIIFICKITDILITKNNKSLIYLDSKYI
jgi:flavin reductase (DIM6/NTAB) family NADH-FMN oxidoreductase RutF